nr:MAG TPA: hypothetical protein [Caudoviricetes sp.]
MVLLLFDQLRHPEPELFFALMVIVTKRCEPINHDAALEA